MNKNVLFVSAGDKTIFYENWLDKERRYDIYVCYYGDKKDKIYEQYSDYYFERKGSKLQNFHYLWNKNDILHNYENYLIVDDDILIKTTEINQLFDYMNEFNLWILQPSFDEKSKISHRITKQVLNNSFRYVNFIEINTPIFSNYAIKKCMEIYNDSLTGYGIDYLFLIHLGIEHDDKYMIVDKISCINPHSEIREIDLLEKKEIRIDKWEKIKKEMKISEYKHKVFKIIQ
jgi:hypothetical protein